MHGFDRQLKQLLPGVLVLLLCISPALAQSADSKTQTPAIWENPGDIGSKDLLNGRGGQSGRPVLPLKFVEEDASGHNSKFDVEDSAGTKWKAKLGIEAQPETVASRLMWAIGYFSNDNYLLRDVLVSNLPAHLHRGQGHVTAPNHLDKARLQRHSEGKKVGDWNLRHNPFVGTREFNGLRVMMALISNWDLKDGNNAIYRDKEGNEHYLVTDLGTAFGASGDRWTEAQSKNNLKAYRSAKFITKVTPKYVDFGFPRYPPFLYIFDLPHFVRQVRLRWIGNHVPREDAKWVGSLLGQLTTRQIEEAFQAGGYSPAEATAFAAAVQARIAELNRL